MNSTKIETGEPPDFNEPFTQKQVEDFIMLCGQSNKPWFKLVMLDEEMAADPTAMKLMESITDVIHAGIYSMGFEDRMTQAKEDLKGVDNGSD